MITSERSVFIGSHFTLEHKEQFRKEADRRGTSMSALLASIIEEWLITAPQEQIEGRSRKQREPRVVATKGPQDVPLPLE